MSKIEKGSIDTDEDEQIYKCLCGVHVRVGARIFSIINILFWSAIIATLTIYYVSNKIPLNKLSWFGFGISNIFLITSASVILGERYNRPWLFIPFMIIDFIKLSLVGISLMCGLLILFLRCFRNPGRSGTVIEDLLKEMEANEITVGYAVVIAAFAFIFVLDVFWAYSWSVILQAYKYIQMQENEKDLVRGLDQMESYPMCWVTETATAPTA